MAVRFSTTGILVGGANPAPRWLSFLDAVLRGMSQIMLQNNSYAGLIFLIGIACNSALIALAALVGTGVSTATARVFGSKSTPVRDGLFGFNGALAAIAVIYSLQPDALTWAYLILAAAATTIVMAGRMGLRARRAALPAA